MSVLELLNKRFATKKFDTSKKVSDEDLAYILECGRASASSFNVQPWKFVVVTNPELRAKLAEAGYNQAQLTEASHLIVLCAVNDPLPRVDLTHDLIEKASGKEAADAWSGMLKGSIGYKGDALAPWLARQSYLALQAMILGAIDKGIDSCPMEGFDAAKWGELLGLKDATVLANLAIGYAAEAGHPKTRLPLSELVEYRA